MAKVEIDDWACSELHSVSLGDKRLNSRSISILKAFSENPESSIPESQRNWSETHAAYRFLGNDKVTHDALIKPHRESSLKRMAEHRIVLAVQDTTSLNFSGLQLTEGLGRIGSDDNGAKGVLVHTTYALSDQGLPLGTLHQRVWQRENKKVRKHNSKISSRDKESSKWIDTIQDIANFTEPLKQTTVIHVMDREADFYELFAETKDLEQNFIIRGHVNRRINRTSRRSNDGCRLRQQLALQNPLGTVELEVKAKDEIENKRSALVQLRALQFKLTPPKNKPLKVHSFKHHEVELTAVQVTEIIQDEEVLEPINWILITNVTIKEPEDVLLCVQYYCCRWQIEVFHRVLKTGCRIESCRFSTVKKIHVYLALLTIVAWRLHWMTLLGRVAPEANASLVFTAQEQTILSKLILKSRVPKNYRLVDFIVLLARLGGFLNRKSDGFPGAQVLWRGWHKLRDFMHNLALIQGSDATYV